MGTIRYKVRALRARWHYRGAGSPCLACTWERGDGSVRFAWIYCDKCDWGNR